MQVNQRGDPIAETQIFPAHDVVSTEDLRDAVNLLCEILGVEIVRTNATKCGNCELQWRAKEY